MLRGISSCLWVHFGVGRRAAFMGSCISCKSGGRAQSYTTIDMESEKIGDTSSNLSRSIRYSKNNNVDSFGFKRRIPTALKSLSQERTSELVQNYENKIANINSNITSGSSSAKSKNNAVNRLNTNNRTLSSNIPRYGSKNSNSLSAVKNTNDTKSLSNSSLSLDSNCNTLTEEMTPETCNSVINGAEEHRLKVKTSDTHRTSSKHSNCFKSSSDHKQKNSEMSTYRISVSKPNSSDGDVKTKVRTPRNALHSNTTCGLPRPQTLNISNKGAIAVRNSIMKNNFFTEENVQAPLAKLDDMEIMHVSSDTLPDEETTVKRRAPPQEANSRIKAGSDKVTKTKGMNSHHQNGTSDSAKTRSIPVRKTTKTIETDQKKKIEKSQMNSSAGRPRGLPIPTKFNSNSKSGIPASNYTKKGQNQVNLGEERRQNSQEEITKKSTNKSYAKCQESEQRSKSTNAPKIKCSQNNFSSLKDKRNPVSDKTEATACKDDAAKPAANTLTEQLQNGKRNEMSSSIESSGSQQDSSLQDRGMFSPPSERDQFLIDDEIADQPELLACHPHEFQRILHPSQETYIEQDLILGDIACESADMCRSHSKETLYSASSINSDDLMLDFDQDEIAAINAHGPSNAKWPRSRHLKLSTSEVDAAFSACSMQMTAAETEDGGTKNDPVSYGSLVQEVNGVKSLLLQLKKALTEADTLNPFDSLAPKNGLFHTLVQSELPYSCGSHEGCCDLERIDDIKKIKQENFDLHRQVIFLQQQLLEKSKACQMLQQQLTKRGFESPVSPQKDVCNAATQTDKPRLSLTTMSQSFEDSLNGTTTVSSDESGNPLQNKNNSASMDNTSASVTQATSLVTRSLNSIIPASNIANEKSIGASAFPERSASAVELHQHSVTNLPVQPAANNCATKSTSNAKLQSKIKTDSASTSAHSKIAMRNSGKGIPPPKLQTKRCATISKSVMNHGVKSSVRQ